LYKVSTKLVQNLYKTLPIFNKGYAWQLVNLAIVEGSRSQQLLQAANGRKRRKMAQKRKNGTFFNGNCAKGKIIHMNAKAKKAALKESE